MEPKSILKTLQKAHLKNDKLLAVLIDPDKVNKLEVPEICLRIEKANADFILMGGSTVDANQTNTITQEVKKHSKKPLILFPGDYTQLTNYAEALLFLNLISGNNPEYLIKQQIKSVPFLEKSNLEVISTGYILIDGGKETSTIKVSNTKPINQNNLEQIKNTAKAGELMGQQLTYLEAGSGAAFPVNKHVVNATFNCLNIPIIVGGGIKTSKQIKEIHQAGATLVVVGTAFENKELF